MHHQQRLAQIGKALLQLLFRDIVQEFLADAERAPGERDFDLALLLDLRNVLPEQTRDMRGIGGRRDGHDRARFRAMLRGGEHRGAAETVADQQPGRAMHFPQVICGGDQIGDVRRERRVGEFAFACAKPGEIEAQHRDAAHGQAFGDALCRQHVLAAGEAVRKQRIRDGLARRPVQHGGEVLAARIGKLKTFGWHGYSPSVSHGWALRRLRTIAPMMFE